jgi:DNA modification methylase
VRSTMVPDSPTPEKLLPLRLEWRSPAELAENPANWRRHPEHQLAALTGVIAEVGWAGACLYNEATGRLIDGHARRKVALDQGAEKVPVLVGRWTPEQEAKILATLDPLSALAEADADKLDELLRSVTTSNDALSAMLSDLAHDNGLLNHGLPDPGRGGDEFDGTPEDGPTRTQPADLWVIGGTHRLLVCDCTAPENVDRLLQGVVPFLMVTDPPYGVEYDPAWREETLPGGARRLGVVANDDRADWAAAYRLFPGPVAYVWHAGRHAAEVALNLRDAGFGIRAQVVWRKQHFAISRGQYHWQHEPCWYAVRDGHSARWCGDRTQSTVWDIANHCAFGGVGDDAHTPHGTQKPLECMARPIRNHGAEGDLVFDPFLGSGTTLVAAHRLGRVCYGCEVEPRYADVILKRAEAEGLACEKAG